MARSPTSDSQGHMAIHRISSIRLLGFLHSLALPSYTSRTLNPTTSNAVSGRFSYVTGSRNPLRDLDLLYTRILSDVPGHLWPITHRILVASTFRYGEPLEVQAICNLLNITRATFYAAMCRLHSVVIVPEPDDAAETPLRFYHAAFLDYLTDPSRSGRFPLEGLYGNHA